jgi:WD40 repeat protein
LTTGNVVRSIDTLLAVNALITLSNGILVTAGGNEIKLWYIDSGNYIKNVSHSNTVNALEVLDDGFASGSDDNIIKIWDNYGVWSKDLDANYPVKCLKRISSNLLASGLSGYNHVLIWFLNNQTIKCDVSGHSNNVNALEMLSNGYLASGAANGWIKIWDIVSCLEENMNLGSPAHAASVNALKLIDTNLMASAGSDLTVRIWDTNTGTLMNQITTNLFNYALELLGIYGINFLTNSINSN